MNNQPLFIAFCGMDGVGKTTQVALLERKFKCSYKVKRVWIRSPHFFAYFIWRFFSLFDYYVLPINNVISQFIWGALEIVSIIPKVLASVYLPRVFGYTLIAERYLVDSLATIICYCLRDPSYMHSWMSNLLLKFVPTNTLLILLDANIDVIVERRLARNSQYDEPVGSNLRLWLSPSEYLSPFIQRKVYRDIAKKANAYIIDTSHLRIDEIHQVILERIVRMHPEMKGILT